MPLLSIRLTTEQQAALHEALAAASLDADAFTERAIRMLAARYGVEYPAAPPSPVQPPAKPRPKSKGGRPRRPATHVMDYDVPAGDFAYVCPSCGREFHSDSDRAVYCSRLCKVHAQNRRQYLRRSKQRG